MTARGKIVMHVRSSLDAVTATVEQNGYVYLFRIAHFNCQFHWLIILITKNELRVSIITNLNPYVVNIDYFPIKIIYIKRDPDKIKEKETEFYKEK